MSDFDVNNGVGEGAPKTQPATDVPMKRDRARLRRPETAPAPPRAAPTPARPIPEVPPIPQAPSRVAPPPVAPTPEPPTPAAMQPVTPAPVTPAPMKSAPAAPPVFTPPGASPSALRDPADPAPTYPGVPPTTMPPPLPVPPSVEPETATSLFAALQPNAEDNAPTHLDASAEQDSPVEKPAPAPEKPSPDEFTADAPGRGAENPSLPGIGLLTPTPLPQPAGLRGLEITAFIAAIVVPPLGLILAIIARGRAKNQRGWVSDLVRYAIPLAAVLTVVLLGAIAVWLFLQGRADANAEIAEAVSGLIPILVRI